MDMKNALTKLVRTAVETRQIAQNMQALGYWDTPYETIFGGIADAVYALLGEHTDTFDESMTAEALCSETLPEQQRVALLFHEWKRLSAARV